VIEEYSTLQQTNKQTMVVDKTNTFSLMRLESSGHRTLQAAVTEQPRGMGKELNQLQWGKQTYYRPVKA